MKKKKERERESGGNDLNTSVKKENRTVSQNMIHSGPKR